MIDKRAAAARMKLIAKLTVAGIAAALVIGAILWLRHWRHTDGSGRSTDLNWWAQVTGDVLRSMLVITYIFGGKFVFKLGLLATAGVAALVVWARRRRPPSSGAE